jgi:hypothetical protein
MNNFGYIILSVDHNINGLKNTVRSIRNFDEESEIISIVGKEVPSDIIKESKEICKIYKAENTITSLINKGFEKSKSEWLIMTIEGSRIPKNLLKKYKMWILDYRDIILPLISDYHSNGTIKNIYNTFYNCSLNGICINRKFFKEVGNLSDNPLEISRTFWALDAKEKGANFKSILGIRIC